jgi:hypothetical protein
MTKEKKKGGRPKGSKTEIGIPIKSLKESIVLTRMAYEKGKESIMSFSEISGHMGLQKGSDTPAMGALSFYGFVEQSEGGWRISTLGKKAINGEKESVRTAFEKVNLFRELSSQFGGKNVSTGLIMDYLKKRYRKGENVNKLIAERFLDGMEYISNLSSGNQQTKHTETIEKSSNNIINLIELKYALKPAEGVDIETLASKVHENFKNNSNHSVKVLSENINKSKKNKEALKVLVDSLLAIMG